MKTSTRFLACMIVGALVHGCNDSTPATDSAVDMGGSDRGTETSTDGPGKDSTADLKPDTKPKPPARWDKAASMAQERSWHTATTLKDGTVLVVGGVHKYNGLKTAERYDPASNKWSAVWDPASAHWHHTATLLDDDRVLILGGCASGPSNLCMMNVPAEIFDPAVKTGNPWKTINSMNVDRRSLCVARMNDGKVFVTGGFDNQKNHTSIEILDPKTGFWSSPAAVLSRPRNLCTATTLKNGSVLIVGGFGQSDVAATLELYNPTSGKITLLTSKLKEPRAAHTAVLLNDGRVLLTGGLCDTTANPSCAVGNAEIYDPLTDKTVTAGSPGKKTYGHQINLLKNGQAFLTGGKLTQKVARLFDPKTSSWIQTYDIPTGRTRHAATLIGTKVLVTGGEASYYSGQTSVEIYTP